MVAENTSTASVSSTRAADRAGRAAVTRAEALHDAELVRRFNAGDQAAFVEIVARYRGKMFQVALRLLRNRADAEEIAQDTFIRAFRGLARFRGDSSLAAWLYRITLNLARNRYWYFFRRRRHTTLPLDAALGASSTATLGDLVASTTPCPVREAVAGEFADLITGCMDRLTAGQREVLVLRNLQHHSYAQISRQLGISVGTVKSRIARARVSLRSLLNAACPEFRPGASPCEWFEPIRASSRLEVICA